MMNRSVLGVLLVLGLTSNVSAADKLVCSGYIRKEGAYWLDLPKAEFILAYNSALKANVFRGRVTLQPNENEPGRYEPGFESGWSLYLRRGLKDREVSVSFNSAPFDPAEGTLGCDAVGGDRGAECAASVMDNGVKRSIQLRCQVL